MERAPSNKAVPRKLLLWAAVIAAGWVAVRAVNMMSRSPETLGVREGRLQPCPDKPNCVCSFDRTPPQAIDPLRYQGPPADAWRCLQDIVAEMPRVKEVARQPGYLRYEFRTPCLGFVDDVEFLHDAGEAVVHVRSASRLGYSDLGLNRRRVEAIRQRLENEVR